MAEFNCTENYKYFVLQFYGEKSWRYAFGTLLAVESFLTMTVNLVVLVVLIKYDALKIPSFKMLRSLALSDMLAGALAGSIASVQLLKNVYSETDCIVDMICTYLEYLFIGTSALTLTCISYDRYLHLSRLNNYKMSNSKLYVFLSICWIIPTVVIVVARINYHITSIIIVTIGGLVLVTLTGSYASILVALNRHVKQNDHFANRKVKQRRAARTVVIILSCFLVMFLPYIIAFSMAFSGHFSDIVVSQSFLISMCLGILNSLINPIIISCNTPIIQKCIKNMFGISETRNDRHRFAFRDIKESLSDESGKMLGESRPYSIYKRPYAAESSSLM